jgi:hypothetical protein
MEKLHDLMIISLHTNETFYPLWMRELGGQEMLRHWENISLKNVNKLLVLF